MVAITIPISFGSFANGVTVRWDSSNCSYYHQYPWVLPNFHHPWLYFRVVLIGLKNPVAYRDQNQKVSCDHFCPEEDCQVLYPCDKSELKLLRKLEFH